MGSRHTLRQQSRNARESNRPHFSIMAGHQYLKPQIPKTFSERLIRRPGGGSRPPPDPPQCGYGQVFIKHFFRFLAAVRSTPPKIGKNAKFSLSIFFDFWRRCVARRQKSKKMPRTDERMNERTSKHFGYDFSETPSAAGRVLQGSFQFV